MDLARGKWQCMYKEERNFDTLHNSVGRMPAWCNEPSVHFARVCVCVCVCVCVSSSASCPLAQKKGAGFNTVSIEYE